MKKAISLFLAVWLSVSLLFVNPVHAEEANRNLYYDLGHTYDEVLIEALKTGVTNLSDSKYGIRYASFDRTMQYLKFSQPEILGMMDAYVRTRSNGYQMLVTGYFAVFYRDAEKYREAFSKRAPEVMAEVNALIPDGATELETIHIVHDYLVSTTAYDEKGCMETYEYTDSDGFTHKGFSNYYCYDASGPFVEHYAVCQGISLAFQYIMNQLGIRCVMVISNKANHGWNAVYLQETGSWYHIDLTSDDGNKDTLGHVGHDYMLLSTDTLLQRAPIRSDYVVISQEHDLVFTDSMCNDNRFESGQLWNNCFTSCHYIGHDLYTLDSLNQVCKNGEPVFTACAATEWAGCLYGPPMGKLAPDGKYVYTTTDDAIWKIDLSDGSYEKTTVDVTRDFYAHEKVFGLAMIEGKLCYTKHTTPDIEEYETWIRFAKISGKIGSVSWALEDDGTVSFSGTLPENSSLYLAEYDNRDKMLSLSAVTALSETITLNETAFSLRLFLTDPACSPLSAHSYSLIG